MSVYQGSRYAKNGVVSRNGVLVPTIRQRVLFDKELGTYYTIIEGDTLDGIAYKQYGNAQLYWAILDANVELQTELDVKPGDVLFIPSIDEVLNNV